MHSASTPSLVLQSGLAPTLKRENKCKQACNKKKGGNSNGKVGQKGSTQPLPPYHCASARFPQLVFTSIVKLLTGTDHVIFFFEIKQITSSMVRDRAIDDPTKMAFARHDVPSHLSREDPLQYCPLQLSH